jgi:predicted MFS family arabinose efflux permease
MLALFLTVLVDRVGFALVIPILPLYAERFGPSPVTLALFMASYPAMQFLFAPLLGGLSDRWGRRPVLSLSLLGSAVGYLILAFAPSLELLFLSRLIDGVSGANLLAARAAITDVTGPAGRTKAMGMIGAAFGLGFILGPALGGLLVQWVDWGPGVAAAALALVAWLMVMTRLPETHAPDPTARINAWRPIDLQALQSAMSRPFLGSALLLVLLLTAARSIFDTTFAQYLVTVYQVEENTVYFLFAYAGLLLVLIQGVLVGPLARRFGDTAVLFAGSSLAGLSLLGIPVTTSFLALLAVLTGLGVGLGVAFPTLMSLTSKLAAPKEVGNVLGLNQSMQSVGRIAGPVLGQLAYGTAVSLPYVGAAALTGAGGLVALLVLGKMRATGFQPDAQQGG